jgi:hypothetical protein
MTVRPSDRSKVYREQEDAMSRSRAYGATYRRSLPVPGSSATAVLRALRAQRGRRTAPDDRQVFALDLATWRDQIGGPRPLAIAPAVTAA